MSNGDLRSLIVATNEERQEHARAAASATQTGDARTPPNVLAPVTLQIAASIRMKNGSDARSTISSRSAPSEAVRRVHGAGGQDQEEGRQREHEGREDQVRAAERASRRSRP